MLGIRQVELQHSVVAELLPVPAGIGEKDHMGSWEGESTALVLAVEEPATLQALRHAVQMPTGVLCCSCYVEAHNPGRRPLSHCVEGVGHVRQAPTQLHCLVLRDQVRSQACLALAACSIRHPDDLPVVLGKGKEGKDALLPVTRGEGRVRGRGGVLHGEQLLDPSGKLDVLHREVECNLLLFSTCSDGGSDVIKVAPVALASTPFAVLERACDLGLWLLAVLASLFASAPANFEMRSQKSWAP